MIQNRYRRNEKDHRKPDSRHPVPTIELIPGQEGVIKELAIYNFHSVIYLTDGEEIHLPDFGLCRLAYYNDNELVEFAEKYELPLSEVKEVRKLEERYISSHVLGSRSQPSRVAVDQSLSTAEFYKRFIEWINETKRS